MSSAAVVEDPTDQHFIEHDLPDTPLRQPDAGDNLAASVEWIWNKAGKEEGKHIVEAVEEWMQEGNNLVTRDLINRLLIRMCSRLQSLKAYILMHWVVGKKAYELTEEDKLVYLHLAAARKKYDRAALIFNKMSVKTAPAFQLLLHAYACGNQQRTAEKLMARMKQNEMVTTSAAYNEMISMYLRLGQANKARAYLDELQASGIAPDARTHLELLRNRELLLPLDAGEMAEAFLSELGEGAANLKGDQWKLVVGIYGEMRQPMGVKRMLKHMIGAGGDVEPAYVPDSYWLAAGEALAVAGDVAAFESLCVALAERNGGHTSMQQRSAMIRAYSRAGRMADAEAAAAAATETAAAATEAAAATKAAALPYVSYHDLVAGHVAAGDGAAAGAAFDRYLAAQGKRRRYTRAMETTVPLLMRAYAQTGDINGAERLVALAAQSHKYAVDVNLFNALLRVYAKRKTGMYGLDERMTRFRGAPNEETAKYLKRVKPLKAVASY